jgi:hypothetical protein
MVLISIFLGKATSRRREENQGGHRQGRVVVQQGRPQKMDQGQSKRQSQPQRLLR